MKEFYFLKISNNWKQIKNNQKLKLNDVKLTNDYNCDKIEISEILLRLSNNKIKKSNNI